MKIHIPKGHSEPVLGYRYSDVQLKELKRNGGKFLSDGEMMCTVCILAGDLIEMHNYSLSSEKRIIEGLIEKFLKTLDKINTPCMLDNTMAKLKESNKMKKVYTVRGSEDGIIGVAGNKKVVYSMVKNYLQEVWNENEVKYTYSQLCKQLKDNCFTMVDAYGENSSANHFTIGCEVEVFYLNEV